MYLKANTDEEIVMVVYTGPCTHETSETYGISHLLEHMICNSYEKYEDFMQEKCITNNAFTDDFSVCFYIRGLGEEISKFKETYVNLVTQYTPTLKDFNKELAIVKQEYNDWVSDKQQAFYLNVSNHKFGKTRPIGTKQALDSITFEKVVDFYSKAFANFSIHEITKEETLSIDNQLSIVEREKSFKYIPQSKIDENCVQCVTVSDLIKSDKLYLLQFICDMLDDGLTSPLMKEIREKKGLSYWVSCWPTNVSDDESFISIGSSVKKENIGDYFNTVYNVLHNYKEFLTEEKFNQIKSKKEIQLKLKNINNAKLSDNLLYEHRKDIDDMKNLDSITYESVMEFFASTIFKTAFKEYTEYDFLED